MNQTTAYTSAPPGLVTSPIHLRQGIHRNMATLKDTTERSFVLRKLPGWQ
jgi:hypothetical protein